MFVMQWAKIFGAKEVVVFDISDERLELDSDVSAELFALTGGGIRDEGEYVPVQTDKLRKAMLEAEPNKSDVDDMAQI